MYDYNCEESPYFKVNAQAYPSKAQQVCVFVQCPLIYVVLVPHHWPVRVYRVSAQLHFIERYLHESDQGFDNLSEEDQMKLKEELYTEVNR